MTYDATRTAVLFIDFQVDVCAEGGRMVSQEADVLGRFKAARTAAAAVLSRVRDHEALRPVFVEHVFESGYPELDGVSRVGMETYAVAQGAFERGSKGAEWVDELRPRTGETVLTKTTISAFASGTLQRWLLRRGIDTVAIAGVVTHYAVLAAALAANDAGFRVVVLEDCCASAGADRHDMALAILSPLADIRSGEAFLAALR